MPHVVSLLIGLIASLAVMIIWEVLGLRDWALPRLKGRHTRKARERFFTLKGDYFLAKSPVSAPDGKKATRVADDKAVDLIKPLILPQVRAGSLAQANILNMDPGLDPNHAAAHFVLLGSTRYSQRPRDLQHWYELPFQYVFEYLHDDPPRRVLNIVSAHGQEYASSLDRGRSAGRWHIDYGLLFIATIPERKRIFWISGIHGAGTIGVAAHLVDHPEKFYIQESASTRARQWLLRIEYDASMEESREMVKHVEVVAGPVNCELRQLRQPIRAVICDFGNVLMSFDRDRTYRALGHAYGRPYKEIAEKFPEETQKQYERGELDDRGFFESVRSTLGSAGVIDFENFSEWWGDIFWENRDVAELLRELHTQVRLVMLSNTNSLHMASVREHYPDILKLFDGHILSFEERLLKPAPELFHRAMEIAGKDVRPEECFYIDDKAASVEAAEKLGMLGHVYSGYPELVRRLRTAGVRVD